MAKSDKPLTDAQKARDAEYRRKYRERNRAKINALAAKYRKEAREKELAERAHRGEPLRGYTCLCSGSDMTANWKPRRVHVESGWRGRPCAGGGSSRRVFSVETAVDWKF